MFSGNKIFSVDKNGNRKRIFFVPGLKIRFHGKNSVIEIKKPFPHFKDCHIDCKDNIKISIGSSKYRVKGLLIMARGKNSVCEIGDNFSVTDKCSMLLHCEENLKIKIGDDCMFASNVVLRTSDAHKIVDNKTGETINLAKPIVIGNHCWIGLGTTILKGVEIADNSVIGTNSLVAKPCLEKNSIYAGVPAKLIKSDISWDRDYPGT